MSLLPRLSGYMTQMKSSLIWKRLLAIGEGDVLLLKKIEKTALRTEFEETVIPIRRKMKKLGITKKDVDSAVKKVRKSS